MLNNSGSDFVESVVNEFKKAIELFTQKNAQYGEEDPLANFRNGALLEVGFDTWAAMYNEARAYSRKHIVHVYGKKKNSLAKTVAFVSSGNFDHSGDRRRNLCHSILF